MESEGNRAYCRGTAGCRPTCSVRLRRRYGHHPRWMVSIHGDGRSRGLLVRDDGVLTPPPDFLRYEIPRPRRTVLGGQRRLVTGRAGSAGARKAATRRATRVARKTWPVSASITAMARPPLPAAMKSP